MTFAALIFAFTISTESNRNFMRAPEWVPEAVGPENSYGTFEHMANPRAGRIGAKDVAAVAAIFDAFYERAYWGSAISPEKDWPEDADDYHGPDVFKVGRNFDFIYKGLIYTNDDGSVIGDTNGTGLVLTDSTRLMEYNNLSSFFRTAYNDFLENDGNILLSRSTWEPENRTQYWACSRMPRGRGSGGSIENKFSNVLFGYFSRHYTGPSQYYSFVPLCAMGHQGALWSEGSGRRMHLLYEFLNGTGMGDELVYGKDDLDRILPDGYDYNYYDATPSDLFDHLYHLGTNGINEADFSRRLLPDIYKDIKGDYFEPGKYTYRTNEMWSVPAALTLAASTLDVTLEPLHLRSNMTSRTVNIHKFTWSSENEYVPPADHGIERDACLPVRIEKKEDEVTGETKFVMSTDFVCPFPNHVREYHVVESNLTARADLPVNYAFYRFTGMVPNPPPLGHLEMREMAYGVQYGDSFDYIETLKRSVWSPNLAHRKFVQAYAYWLELEYLGFVYAMISIDDGSAYPEEHVVSMISYDELWKEDTVTNLDFRVSVPMRGEYSVSRSASEATDDSYYHSKPVQSERLNDFSIQFFAAELFRVPTQLSFIEDPATIGPVPSPIPYDPDDESVEYYRSYEAGGADSIGKVVDIVNDRLRGHLPREVLGWRPETVDSMKPEGMIDGVTRIRGECELMKGFMYSPDDFTPLYLSFDSDGYISDVYSASDTNTPITRLEGRVDLMWSTSTGPVDGFLVDLEVNQLNGERIRPPIEIDDRFGAIMRNEWKWKACGRKD